MEKTILISIEISDLQRIIIDSVNTCLKYADKPTRDGPQSDRFLTISQAAELLNLAVPTVYGLVHRSMIPVCKRNKRLYFSEKELRDWIKVGRRQTLQEIKQDASQSLYHK
jgi:excisionase family DNA binding protein